MTNLDANKFEEARTLLASKRVICWNCSGKGHNDPPRTHCIEGCVHGRIPDPAYAPLLVLFQDEHEFPDPDSNGGVLVQSALDYWQDASNGAFEGALMKATAGLSDVLRQKLAALLWLGADTRQAALDALVQWLKEEK